MHFRKITIAEINNEKFRLFGLRSGRTRNENTCHSSLLSAIFVIWSCLSPLLYWKVARQRSMSIFITGGVTALPYNFVFSRLVPSTT